MKIRKLHIKNYKVFNDLELDFTDANGKTLDTIVLAGVNGCGKTTVLEIIRKMFDLSFDDYFKDSKDGFIEIEVEITSIEKTAVIRRLTNTVNGSDPEAFIEEHNIINLLKSDNNYFKLSFNSTGIPHKATAILLFMMLYQHEIYSKSLKLFYLPIQNNVDKSKIKSRLEIIHLSSSKNQMKELALKGIRDEVFKNRNIPPQQNIENAIKQITKALNGMNLTTRLVDLESEELIFQSANGQKIKFEDLSNGEQNLYFRAIYLSKLNPIDSIIMIDEPEDSLHPIWQQKVMKLYQNISENNQIIVATHSPHIIGSANTDEVFLLEIDENQVEAKHPRYTKGHSIKHILKVMGTDPNDTVVIEKVDTYIALIRKGLQETVEGRAMKVEIDALNLDPNSEEMNRLSLSLQRFKAVGV